MERYFRGEEKIAKARLAALENFPKIKLDDWIVLRKFLDALESYTQSSPFDPQPHARENVMTMTLIKRTTPTPWYQKFVTWCLENGRVCIPSNFLDWANNRVDPHLFELSFSSNSKRNVTFLTTDDPDSEEFIPNVSNTSSPDVCVKCGGGHTVKHCEKFYLMQPVERKDLILNDLDLVTINYVFVDASTASYAAVAYAVTTQSDKTVSHLFMSKTRVSPISKQESVARLELSACQLGATLAQKLSSAMEVPKSELTFWTDSSTCLYWLHTKENLSTYVANHVCFILDNTQPTQWKHVTTDQNPADIPTRGSLVAALVDNDMWWTGPEFLCQHESLWREQPLCTPTDDALSELITLERAIGRYSFATQGGCHDSPLEHLSLDRLASDSPGDLILRVRALERILVKLGKKIAEDTRPILYYLIKHLQQTYLPELLQAVRDDKTLPKRYRKLSPFLQDGIFRVGGHLAKADLLSDAEKYPIILPKDNLISEHIVMDIHRRLLHHVGGPLHLMNQLQRRYWLFGGRAEITRILRHRCRTRHPERHPDHTQLSPLHHLRFPARIHGNIRPFLKVSLDLAGPWLTVKPRDTRQRFNPPARAILNHLCVRFYQGGSPRNGVVNGHG